jgi:hypothetical protein
MRISILFLIASALFGQTPPEASQLERNKQLVPTELEPAES